MECSTESDVFVIIEYVCPKCGHFNAAPRSLKRNRSPNVDGGAVSPEREGRLPRPNFLSVPDSPEGHGRSISRSPSRGGSAGGVTEEGDRTQDSIMSVDES